MTKRVRLSPHDRRMQLLDCAGQIVLDSGLSKFTIDALATQAGVSVPLIYKYFATRNDILQALLQRESTEFNKTLKARLKQASSYEDVVRVFVELNFDDARTGSLLTVLFSQPDVREGLGSKEFGWVGQVLINQTAEEFGLSKAQARSAVPLASAASRAAADRFSRKGGDRQQAVDETIVFILGAFRALGAAGARDKLS